jgi:glucans biosynthesis protein
MNRRTVLKYGVCLAVTAAGGTKLVRTASAHPDPTEVTFDFDRDWLVQSARDLAAKDYQAPAYRLPEALDHLDWDQYQSIRFHQDKALWAQEKLPFQVQFFHLGLYYKEPVAIYEVTDGKARLLPYDPAMFDFGAVQFDPPLPEDLGFAGFRLHYKTNFGPDMVAFLGASYFRAVGATLQYGLSARGLAIDTGLPHPEEFPVFRAFWLERPEPSATSLRVHALLDSPSVSGAYTFLIRPGSTTEMDVDCILFFRKAIERLGIAPLTSMFHHGENEPELADDFRPEVHDSDGLALHTGDGEWIWRPLENPSVLQVNSFVDERPRGFGLLQRDRDFDHYQDDGVYYDRRPNLWVEPLADWGKGAVQLVEIPAGEETFDNIVAFWNPARPVAAGDQLRFAYRLYWGSEMPDTTLGPGRVVATRIGRGGIPGQPVPKRTRKFVIDFVGGDLPLLAADANVTPVIIASSGEIRAPAARPIRELRGWRVNFDLQWSGPATIVLRCLLTIDGTVMTETWSYQWTPPASPS